MVAAISACAQLDERSRFVAFTRCRVGFAGFVRGRLHFRFVVGFCGAAVLRRRHASPQSDFPAITLLKPLHGIESGLEGALASFLRQDYPGPIQFVFGLRYTGDLRSASSKA